jgi:hypothetical protein
MIGGVGFLTALSGIVLLLGDPGPHVGRFLTAVSLAPGDGAATGRTMRVPARGVTTTS